MVKAVNYRHAEAGGRHIERAQAGATRRVDAVELGELGRFAAEKWQITEAPLGEILNARDAHVEAGPEGLAHGSTGGPKRDRLFFLGEANREVPRGHVELDELAQERREAWVGPR